MKKIIFITFLMAAFLSTGCSSCNNKKKEVAQDDPNVIVLFDGETFEGWRAYNGTEVPGAWTIEDGAIKINGSGRGEAGAEDGGDIIYDRKFGNFELTFEWKVGKGSNSGVFYLAQEIQGQPIYISAPEYQILDNEHHPDAFLGVDGNRQSASFYDMIPAKPQNAKPYGEWNTAKILVYKGTVAHFQNEEPVLEYHLWTQQWQEMLDNCKFSQEKWPIAYDLLLHCGGEEKEGFIGLQDHGDDVWFKNIKVRILD